MIYSTCSCVSHNIKVFCIIGCGANGKRRNHAGAIEFSDDHLEDEDQEFILLRMSVEVLVLWFEAGKCEE